MNESGGKDGYMEGGRILHSVSPAEHFSEVILVSLLWAINGSFCHQLGGFLLSHWRPYTSSSRGSS